jgi:hypothetical protein
MTWPVTLRREDSMAFLGVFKQAVKQIRTADNGEVGSSWFRSQPVSLVDQFDAGSRNRSNSSSDGVFGGDTLPATTPTAA